MLFDLDDFKRFNDEGGHAAGDAVLAQVARAATRVLRAGEELFRVGGDEFALVVTGGADAGRQVADRVQEALGAQTRGGSLPTISAGVATYPPTRAEPAELLAAADDALYASKRRRQVTRFQNPASWRHERRRAGAGRHPSPGRPPRPSTALRRRRPGPADAAADDLRADRHRGRRGEDGRGRARRDRRTAAGRDRARHRPARRRRPDALPPAQGRPGDELDRRRPAHRDGRRGCRRRPAARARTRCCGSRSARSSCSPSSSGSPAASRTGPFEPRAGGLVGRAAAALRERPAAAARDRARPAGAAAPHLRADRRRARRRARVEGLRHRDALAARAAVRGRARAGDRAGPAARPERRVRLPPPRRRQDRDPRPRAAEARAARRLRAAPDADAHAARRAAAARRRPAPRRGAAGRPRPSRALGRPRLPRRARRPRTSRSRPGSSPSPTCSTRSRATAPTAPPAAGTTRQRRSSPAGAGSSTRRSSTPSGSASPRCARSGESSRRPRA